MSKHNPKSRPKLVLIKNQQEPVAPTTPSGLAPGQPEPKSATAKMLAAFCDQLEREIELIRNL